MISPPAALEIAEHTEEKSAKVRLKISLFSAFSANSAVIFLTIAHYVYLFMAPLVILISCILEGEQIEYRSRLGEADSAIGAFDEAQVFPGGLQTFRRQAGNVRNSFYPADEP
jgi:hypothetical protein